ncbi:arabinan endo-1,5-alpha-L-arabinosidase [Pedobacter sp. UYP30]|uniref:glycoside hydrolase family 43 protein n=1 Tax=Pedobacter sp. UYP30 TaxID=1756400 RepID=UPI003393CA04
MIRINITILLLLVFGFSNVKGQQRLAIDANFADPTVILYQGVYYAYATQASVNGVMHNIQLATSTDLKTWKMVGDVLPVKPLWAKNTQDFWAPHVLYDDEAHKFVLFFSAKSDDKKFDKCIGVAFSDTPEGPFLSSESPIVSGPGFENIDPFAIHDKKTHKNYLFWGSGFQPIKVREMSRDWKTFAKKSVEKALVYPGREKKYSNLIEGAWVDFCDGFYYLYYSGDNCCGVNANYAVMVARSKHLIGSYSTMAKVKNIPSSVVLAKNENWLAPGHNSIFKDKIGQRWIAYHAIHPKQLTSPDQKRVMLISRLVYKNGWPVVEIAK